MNNRCQAPVIHGQRPWTRKVDKTARKGTSLVPERVVSGTRGVPAPAATHRETTNPRGRDRSEHQAPPLSNHHRQGGCIIGAWHRVFTAKGRGRGRSTRPPGRGHHSSPNGLSRGREVSPPQPPRIARPPPPEGENGQNTTHHRSPTHHRQGGCINGAWHRVFTAKGRGREWSTRPPHIARPPTPEGENGQNTTHHPSPTHHRQVDA
jgi:hypothetical protein